MTEHELRRAILQRQDLSAGSKIALFGVMLRLDWETWSGECSVTEVMSLTALSRSGVSRAFNQLKEAGIIERSHTQDGPRARRAQMSINIESIFQGVHNVDGPQKNPLTIHKKNGSQNDPIHKRSIERYTKEARTGHKRITNGSHYGENQYIQPNNNNNQQTRATREVAVEEVSIELEGQCYKPYSYTPVDLNEEKKKRRHTLTAAFQRCGLEQQYKVRWIRWYGKWREENCPLWHHMPWSKYDIDVQPAIEQIKEEQEKAKEMRHPLWTN